MTEHVRAADLAQEFSQPDTAENPIPDTCLEEGLSGKEFLLAPLPPSGLAHLPDIDFIWQGYLAPGHATLLVGLFKAGKSTLLGHLLRATAEGGELAGTIKPARVLVISEESQSLWKRRCDEIGIGENVAFACRPFKTRPNWLAWEHFVSDLQDLVVTQNFSVVVFDTISSLLPVADENSAADMNRALMPLNALTEQGAAILMMHHPRKGDAAEGQASRGSGALPGWVDVIVEFRRFDPKSVTDRRRVLRGLSRFDETQLETVIELQDDGYRTLGSKADASREGRLVIIRGILSATPKLTPCEVRAAWPDDHPAPSEKTIARDLAAANDIGRNGAGKKGDPHRFFLESNAGQPPS